MTLREQRLVLLLMSAVLLVGVSAYGVVMSRAFSVSLAPELNNRATLIGETLRVELDRALALRIPLEDLAGVDAYLNTFLDEYPELDYVAIRGRGGATLHSAGTVAAGREGTVFEVGATRTEAGNSSVYLFPLSFGSVDAGLVEVGVDRHFVRSILRDAAWDLMVILAVALVAAFEVTLAVGQRIGKRTGVSARTGVMAGDVRLALFVFAVGEELNKSFLPLYLEALPNPFSGVDPKVAITLPIISYLLTLALAVPLAGRLTRRLGARNLFLIGVVPAALSHLGMVYATDLAQVIGLRGLTGVGYALVTIACQEYLLDLGEQSGRARNFGVFVSVVIGGTFAGTALGGIFADSFGYSAVFLISMLLVLGAGLFASGMMAGPSGTTGDGPTRGGVPRPGDRLSAQLGVVLTRPSLLALLLGVTIPMSVTTAAFLWYLAPLQLAGAGAGAAVIARIVMIYYLVIWLGTPLLSALGDRLHNRWPLVGAGSLLAGLALLLPASSPSQLAMTLAVLVVGLGHAAVRGPQVALALDLAERCLPDSGRAAILAAMRTLERLGSLVGLLVVGALAGRLDLQAGVMAVALTAIFAAFGFLIAGLFVSVRTEEVIR